MADAFKTATGRVEARVAVYRSRAQTAVDRGYPVEVVRDALRIADAMEDLLHEIRKIDEVSDGR